VKTLQSVLEIVAEILPEEERKGLALAEEIYKLYAVKEPVAKTLDRIITEFQRRKQWYPRILFRRLKEIQEGKRVPDETIPFPDKQPVPSDYGVHANPQVIERDRARRQRESA
jgi:hypothetical protein